jgi:hypothetical protein
VASTSGPAVMTAIPAQPGAEVNVAIPPLPGVGRGKKIMAPMSPSGWVLGSPTQLELEGNLGATPALVDVETETGLLVEPEEAQTRGDKHLDQMGDPLVL